MFHVGFHLGSKPMFLTGGGGGAGGGGHGPSPSREYTIHWLLWTVLLQLSACVIQRLAAVVEPVGQSDRTSNERHRASALQFASACCTHSSAVLHRPSARLVLGPQAQCDALQPEVEVQTPVARLNLGGGWGQKFPPAARPGSSNSSGGSRIISNRDSRRGQVSQGINKCT